jgi:hypothetical protein
MNGGAPMTAMVNGYPTEEDLRNRITRQLDWHDSSDTVALLWRGYLAGLIEWDPQTTRTQLSLGGVEYRLPNGQGVVFEPGGKANLLDPRWEK